MCHVEGMARLIQDVRRAGLDLGIQNGEPELLSRNSRSSKPFSLVFYI